MAVINGFFSYGDLPEIRQAMWEMHKTTVSGNFSKELNWRERSNIVYFYEQLAKLVKAVHVLYVTEKGKNKKKGKKNS
jgi:hypothetical protein